MSLWIFSFNDPATTEIYTLSLHDALPISGRVPEVLRENVPVDGSGVWNDVGDGGEGRSAAREPPVDGADAGRSEEHTSELQSRQYLVCRPLLEQKPPSPCAPRTRPVAMFH